jgi:hypothetical protein
MNDDWLHRIFSVDDLEDLNTRAEKILYNNENGFIASIALTNEQCIELLHHYYKSRGMRFSFDSLRYVEEFLFFMIQFLEEYLIEEGIDFNEEYKNK